MGSNFFLNKKKKVKKIHQHLIIFTQCLYFFPYSQIHGLKIKIKKKKKKQISKPPHPLFKKSLHKPHLTVP